MLEQNQNFFKYKEWKLKNSSGDQIVLNWTKKTFMAEITFTKYEIKRIRHFMVSSVILVVLNKKAAAVESIDI